MSDVTDEEEIEVRVGSAGCASGAGSPPLSLCCMLRHRVFLHLLFFLSSLRRLLEPTTS